MADIDKALPNDKRPEEVAEEVDVCLLYTSPSPRDS